MSALRLFPGKATAGSALLHRTTCSHLHEATHPNRLLAPAEEDRHVGFCGLGLLGRRVPGSGRAVPPAGGGEEEREEEKEREGETYGEATRAVGFGWSRRVWGGPQAPE